jgi:CBS-domain-containing membrane protein
VEKVKRAEGYVIDHPYCIGTRCTARDCLTMRARGRNVRWSVAQTLKSSLAGVALCTDPSATYKDLDEKMEEAGVSSILVVQEGKLMGVVTRRDVALIDDPNEPVSKVDTTTHATHGTLHDLCGAKHLRGGG